MKITLLLLMLFNTSQSVKSDFIIKFGKSTEKISDWTIISDNVMGGLTKSTLMYTENSLLLTGNLSLENYGGFSSVKSKFKQMDLSEYKGIKIKFRSNNQKYAITLEDSRNWTKPYYKGAINEVMQNGWVETMINFSDFETYQIGEPTGEKLKKSVLKNILRVGIMTTEKKEGPFSIEVEYIEFVK
jgi:monofunctional biosynthetic peptidoglycan transglycosylase